MEKERGNSCKMQSSPGRGGPSSGGFCNSRREGGEELKAKEQILSPGKRCGLIGGGSAVQCLAGRGGFSPGRKLRHEKREETAAVAASGRTPMWQRGRRPQGPGGEH